MEQRRTSLSTLAPNATTYPNERTLQREVLEHFHPLHLKIRKKPTHILDNMEIPIWQLMSHQTNAPICTLYSVMSVAVALVLLWLQHNR